MAADLNEDAVAQTLAELAEAEAAQAEAEAEAARAKATAARLRGPAPAASDEDEPTAIPTEDEPTEAADEDAPAEGAVQVERRGWWLRRGRLVVASGVVALVVIGSLVLTAMMVVQHQKVAAQRAHQAQLVDAARSGVTALLSIDYNRAQADVQHVIDLSTGTFKDDFTKGADDFVKTAEQSKAVTVGSIKSAALENDGGDTGLVLVAASSTVTNANGAQQDPRAWRMSVTVARDGDKFKMSNVEFVP